LVGSFRVGEFEIQAQGRRVLSAGEPLPLGARAFDLLLALIEHRDRVVGKDELLSLAWPGLVVEENNLSVQVSALRKLLGADAIATVAGRGYRFTLPLQDVPAVAATRRPDEGLARVGLAPEAERASIAVLPFEARSEDAAIGFLADGLVEDVIAQLARVPGFLVISRGSSFEFRRRDESLSAVARQLGVRYVVEGSVRQGHAQLSVSTHLVEAESARVLWTGRFKVDREAAPDLQEDIARGIISELEPELTRAEITLIRRRRPEDVDAWGHYHQGVGAISLKGWTEGAIAEALASLEHALAIDPGFALAWAYSSLITALAMTTGLRATSATAVDSACRAAEQALLLDDGDSQVLGYAGCALSDLGQRERGAEILQLALAIDPSNAQAHVALGTTRALQGQWEQGIRTLRHGMRISPRDRRLGFWGWALAQFLLRSGQTEEALAEARTSAGRDARLHLPRIIEAAALQALGRADEARIALAVARRLRPSLTPVEVEHAHGRRVARQIASLWPVGDQPVA
jgi:TolB-like protein/Tfp pilus assembly protein PilF